MLPGNWENEMSLPTYQKPYGFVQSVLRNYAPAFLVLTATMLNKAIIDANASIRAFAKAVGIDYEQMQPGEKHVVEGVFTDGTPTVLSFYRTVNRGDRRFSVRGIKKQCEAGDTVALTFKVTTEGEVVWVVNVTRQPEYRQLVEAS
tara:strand:- start:1345 stop:1782 length:438 start_codon:yes stop_codon:yes gene_type:complete